MSGRTPLRLAHLVLQVHVRSGEERRNESPTWAEVEAAIGGLDEAHLDQVILTRWWPAAQGGQSVEDESLYVDGGARNRVVVTQMLELAQGTAFYQVVERARGQVHEDGLMGQQTVDLPAMFWVTKDLAVAAARHFVEHGGRAPDLDWQLDVIQ